jgi:hypothetical protein
MTPEVKKALDLALEALENHEGNYKLDVAGCDRHDKAITAIKQALAAPTVQPVAHLFTNVQSGDIEASTNPDHKEGEREMWYREPLVRPPAAQQAPVPLTDEQIVAKALHLSGLGTNPDVLQFARAIEAAHGVKEKT